ncbi:hypothetical protein GHT06_011923 [Daphnia sinensis]|uniref:Replication factor C subunit 1 n=1 Tax=Daphnia sinensis TaxID=1820382 RepID=A0AAD5KUY0_9CRUS|nr:hypothetical protein GHT06_011923 [Daphnia sinensis]
MAPPKSPKTASVKGDIRNFFTSISSKTSTSKSPGSAPASKEEDGGKRKKKAMVLVDSTDSESEAPSRSSAPTKKSKLDEKPKKESVPSATKSKTKTSIPETPLQPVDISSVFGSKPIKRDIPEKRKRTVIEDHDDEDFEATLQQLDEAPLTKKSKVLEKNKPDSPSKKEKAKSPTKEEKSKSPAKEEKSKPSASPPSRNGKKSSKEVETKKETVLDKKRKTPDETATPKKNTPTKEAKQSEGRDKKSKKELQEIDSNSNKTPPKSNKKIKPEPTVVKETPKKRTASQDDDPDVIDSPAFDAIEKRKEKAENYKRFLASRRDGGAKNPGSKPIPEGAPGCLTGLTIVVTGVLESLHREEAEGLVKKYGGKAPKAVSKNTSYLLAGDDAGPSKLAKAQSMNVPIISEDDFLKMIATRNAAQGLSSPAGKKVPTTPKSGHKATTSKSVKSEPEPVITSVATPTKKRSPETKKIDSKPKASSSSSTTPTKKVEAERKKPDASEGNGEAKLPWVDKYKPTNLKQVIGMHGDRSIAKKLLYWLKSWYDNRSSTKKLTKPSPWSTNDDGAYFKAALLSGSPGIGKTTTAHLAAKELGYDIVEMNASDTRSKRLLHEHVQELMSSQSLATYAHGSAQIQGGRKRVLIMDEVDGMAGNEDRGGVQELIGLIKTSKIPVICICNDRQHPKIRSLANYCYDLKFSKPRMEQIRGAMMSICYKEGISLKPEALDEIIMGANQDVRQILHHLSMLASDKSVSNEKAKLEASKSKKDMKLGPWEVVKKVFSAEEHRGMSIHDKTGLFFQDYSFGPLFVQENYPYVVPHAAKGNAIKTLDLLGRTAHCMSQTDLIEKVIRSQNAWSLLPVEAVFASVVPGQLMEGFISSQVAFPSWLGKNSRTNKMDRLLQELQMHMRLKISGSKRAVNLDYLPHILNSIVGPLKRSGADGVAEAITAMESYDLMREDLDSLLELAQWPHKPDIMAGVEGKVKAAFTRAYNKEGHMTPYAVVQVKKGRSKDAADDQEALVDEDGLAEEEDDEEQSEDPSLDAMIKVKKETKKTATSTTVTVGGLRWGGKGGTGRSQSRRDNVDSSSNNIVAALHHSIIAIVIT